MPRGKADEVGWVTALNQEIILDHRHFSTEPLHVFFDKQDIVDMDDWRHRILRGIRTSKILLVCISPNYLQSPYCQWELEEYCRRQSDRGIGQDSIATVYFVDVPGWGNIIRSDCYSLLQRSQYTDLRPWFPEGVAKLRDDAVRRRIAALGASLWERIQRSRMVVPCAET